MSRYTILLGAALVVLGLIAYFVTGRVHVTALIPSFFGLIFLALGGVGQANEAARKHVMHAAAALALLGLFGTVGALRFAVYMISVGPNHVDNPPAIMARSIMAIGCAVYLYAAIRSFREARRKRVGAE